MLVKDFSHFTDRTGPDQRKIIEESKFLTDRIWSKQLLIVAGEDWKNIR